MLSCFNSFFLRLSTNNNTRVFGQCSTACLDHSQVISMELAATHRAFLLNRHWVVYVNTQCPYHGSQTWSFEKLFHPGRDFKYSHHQTVELGTIFISCSQLFRKQKSKRTYQFRNHVSLARAISALSSAKFFYSFFYNCKRFGRTTYRSLEKLDTPASYLY